MNEMDKLIQVMKSIVEHGTVEESNLFDIVYDNTESGVYMNVAEVLDDLSPAMVRILIKALLERWR